MIEVKRTARRDLPEFDVVVNDGKGETMSAETCERLAAGKCTAERVVEAAFRFLLDREPKESILGAFDVMVIARYFPDFETELPRYLSRS